MISSFLSFVTIPHKNLITSLNLTVYQKQAAKYRGETSVFVKSKSQMPLAATFVFRGK